MNANTHHKFEILADNAIGICIVAIITSLLFSCVGYKHLNSSVTENGGWTLVKVEKVDNPSWKIYSRQLSGTNFLEYHIKGQISLSPKACIASFKQDIQELANGSEPQKFPVYEIVHKSQDSLLTYVIHNEPFPLKDTEMSVRYVYFSYDDGSKVVKWHEAWHERLVEPSKKLNRVETFRGSWTFTPTIKGSTKAVNLVQFDPQKMPRWLVEPMVIKFLKDGLEAIREKSPKSLHLTHSGNSIN